MTAAKTLAKSNLQNLAQNRKTGRSLRRTFGSDLLANRLCEFPRKWRARQGSNPATPGLQGLTSSVLYPSELSARRNSGDMRAHVFRQDPMNERLVPDVATPGFPPEALQHLWIQADGNKSPCARANRRPTDSSHRAELSV